ncbi:MAG: alpha-ketoacid dehydrogenase subunit beta [Deltaproteobacteria bacterium]|nr:alpha-ketoacid dehydrogenase subunit beta [Deltaproteobacteria bacterium]
MATMTYGQALNSALETEMQRDENVLCLGIDIGEPGGPLGITQGLYDKFGAKRVRDTPITESGFVGAAVGAAVCGLRPVAEIMFVDFVGVAMDQIFNQAAKMRYMFGGRAKVPVVIRTTYGVGMAVGAQHSQSLEAWFMHVPGLKVVMPSTPCDAKGLLISAIRDNNPVVFLENKMLYGVEDEVPEDAYEIPIGRADIKREGRDVTIVATGQMVGRSLSAAGTLAESGVEAEVVDPRTLLPLDTETILASVKKTHRLVIVHEEVKFAGSGAEIAAMVAEEAFDYLDAPILRVGGPFCPIPFSPKLEAEFLPSEQKIIDAVTKALDG